MSDLFTILTDQGTIHYNEKSMSTFADVERSAMHDTMTRNVIKAGRANDWSSERTLCAIISVLQNHASHLFAMLVDAQSKRPQYIVLDGVIYKPKDELE